MSRLGAVEGEDVGRGAWPLFALLVATFLLFGVAFTIVGATLPEIIRRFQWSYTVTGVVMSAGAVGYFVATFLSGLLVERIGPRLLAVGGLALQGVGLAFLVGTPAPLPNVALNFLIGLGGGGVEVVANLSVVRLERHGQSRLMNLMHGAFSLGAILGPMLVGAILASKVNWRVGYWLAGAASVLLAAALALMPFGRLARAPGSGDRPDGAMGLLRQPVLILCAAIILLYVGAEMGVSNWVAEYYVRLFGAPASVGAFMVSIFWSGVLIGRLIIFVAHRGTARAELLAGMGGVCTAGLLAALVIRHAWISGACFFVCGLGCSGIYPVVMAMLGRHFPNGQGFALGIASTGGGIGAFVFPFIMAAISDRFGIARGFYFYVGLDAVMLALIVGVVWQIRRRSR